VLVIQDLQRRVLLERRPPRGVWGGLFSFPELAAGDDAQAWCRRRLGVAAAHEQALAPIEHAFTHFDLSLEPLLLRLDTDCAAVMDAENLLWYRPAAPSSVGIAAPINALLESLERPGVNQ
jgi:A/G-specific adenine glycosylase